MNEISVEEKIRKLKAEIAILEFLLPYSNNGKLVFTIEMIKELKEKYIEIMSEP